MSDNLLFISTDDGGFRVLLAGRHAGNIRKVEGGWQYWPKGQREGGPIYKMLVSCRESLGDVVN